MDIPLLQSELKLKREAMAEDHAIRLHRAVSWLKASNAYTEDKDVAFITLWIAFNACYSIDSGNGDLSERASFKGFTTQLVALDVTNQLYNCLWNNYAGFVKAVVNNSFIFAPFWESQRQQDNTWEARFNSSKKAAMKALANSDTATLIQIVLDRLYVLRNQLIHGGATYKSQVNREQVSDGCRFLSEVMPIIVKLMMENPSNDWGDVSYPVIK